MKKVLIISYAYPPQNEIAARRFSEMVPYFPENGWEPYILTTHSKGDLNFGGGEEIIYRKGFLPELDLNKNRESLLVKKINSFRRKLGFLFRIFDSALYKWSNQILNDGALIRELDEKKFDVIVASYGPSSVLRIGSFLSSKLSVPIVYDFRDLGALHEGADFKQNYIARLIDKKLEGFYLSGCKGITTVSHGLAERLKENYEVDVRVVYNGWAALEGGGIESKDNESDVPYIYYAGRFYEHRMKSFFLLIDSIGETSYRLVIRSLGPRFLEDAIIEYAAEKNVQDRIRILPRATSETIEKESHAASINLVVEDMDRTYRSTKGTLTGKFMQLLVYDAPVLAIAREDSEIGDILRVTEKGALVSDFDGIKYFFEEIKNDQLAYPGNKSLSKFSKKMQAIGLARFLDEVIG